MDYETRPISRNDLRVLSKYFRELFDVSETGPFPVLEALDKVSEVFEGSNYIIVEDSELVPQQMAQCVFNEHGGYTIQIKDSVYSGAYENNVGACLGFICHEICHVFLFTIGFTPIDTNCYKENEIPAYCSVEWQAKALCAEVMVPYEESIGMMPKQIIENYHVSKAFAANRRKLEKKEKIKKTY